MRAFIVAAAIAVLLCACGERPADLLETAQFEEVQHNPEHARQLYEDIVRRFPDSAEAATARTRLDALRAAP